MPPRRLLLLFTAVFFAPLAQSASVLVLPFHNESQYADVTWVGEGIAEVLRTEFSTANLIVLDRDSRAEGLRRLSLRRDALWTKASLIRLGQTLDVDYICYGTYEVTLSPGTTDLRTSSVRIAAHFIDLRKMHDGPELSEAGALPDLSRLEEHLAWQSLKFLTPGTSRPIEQFMSPQKLVRLDAQESYVRGLLSPTGEQQQKWFAQAALLDPHYSNPVLELGKLALARHDYRQAISWLQRIVPTDPVYDQARFKMGQSSYYTGDYNGAIIQFRLVAAKYPLNEVYNNLAAAEMQLNQPAAADDLRRALEGYANDPIYQFNQGIALLKSDRFDEAAARFQTLLDASPSDADARTLLERAQSRQPVTSSAKLTVPARLKQSYDETAFRQMKSMFPENGGK